MTDNEKQCIVGGDVAYHGMDMLIRTFEDSKCEQCGNEVPTAEGVVLNFCLHSYCLPCLIGRITNSTAPVVDCPQAQASGCQGVLMDFEVKAITVLLNLPELNDLYVARSLAQAQLDDKRYYKCARENCSGVWFLEDNGNQFVNCPICKQNNCLHCREIHDGLSCQQYLRKIGAYKRKTTQLAVPATSKGSKKRKLNVPVGTVSLPKDKDELSANWDKIWREMCSNYKRLSDTSNYGRSETLSEDRIRGTLKNSDCSDCIVVPNYEFECPICMTDVPTGDGVALLDCYHTFCKGCLISTIEHSEYAQVKCPFAGDYSCPFHIQDREVQAICPSEMLEKYEKRFVTQAELNMKHAFHCCTKNCTNWVEVDEVGVKNFKCSICSKMNCIPCNAIHEAVSCVVYQAELKLAVGKMNDEKSEEVMKRMLQEGKAMRCPQCRILIIKDSGCDALTCRVCKTSLCWATKGFRWGPKGHGDLSGGCKCRSAIKKFKKCTANCHNCH